MDRRLVAMGFLGMIMRIHHAQSSSAPETTLIALQEQLLASAEQRIRTVFENRFKLLIGIGIFHGIRVRPEARNKEYDEWRFLLFERDPSVLEDFNIQETVFPPLFSLIHFPREMPHYINLALLQTTPIQVCEQFADRATSMIDNLDRLVIRNGTHEREIMTHVASLLTFDPDAFLGFHNWASACIIVLNKHKGTIATRMQSSPELTIPNKNPAEFKSIISQTLAHLHSKYAYVAAIWGACAKYRELSIVLVQEFNTSSLHTQTLHAQIQQLLSQLPPALRTEMIRLPEETRHYVVGPAPEQTTLAFFTNVLALLKPSPEPE